MSIESRVTKLEHRLPPEEEPFTFTFAPEPPEGLTAAQQDEWRAEYQRECEAQGVFWFTLDLGAAAVRQGDDE